MPSNLYPTEVDIKDSSVEKLTRTFKNAYKQIISEISTATDFGSFNRQQILSQIEVILTNAGVDVQQFLNEELPGYYEVGADYAVKQLKNVGAEVPFATGFNRIHQDAIKFLVDDTSKSMFEALTGVKRSAELLLNKSTRDLLTQQIATSAISGEAIEQAKIKIKGILADQGLPALKDKAGRSWSLDRYSETVFRTKVVEARNHGFANRIVENGFDLVQVSSHPGSCPLCTPWQGKILSLTGRSKGYPTLAEAERDGLFHPNCRHAINVMIPSLARKTSAYSSGE